MPYGWCLTRASRSHRSRETSTSTRIRFRYLAAILDLYARVVVGWAVSAVNDRHLTGRALDQALRRRSPEGGLMHHSDQGSTYASQYYRQALAVRGITCSMKPPRRVL